MKKIIIPNELVDGLLEQLAAVRGVAQTRDPGSEVAWDRSALGKFFSMLTQEDAGSSSSRRATSSSNRSKARSRFRR